MLAQYAVRAGRGGGRARGAGRGGGGGRRAAPRAAARRPRRRARAPRRRLPAARHCQTFRRRETFHIIPFKRLTDSHSTAPLRNYSCVDSLETHNTKAQTPLAFPLWSKVWHPPPPLMLLIIDILDFINK